MNWWWSPQTLGQGGGERKEEREGERGEGWKGRREGKREVISAGLMTLLWRFVPCELVVVATDSRARRWGEEGGEGGREGGGVEGEEGGEGGVQCRVDDVAVEICPL